VKSDEADPLVKHGKSPKPWRLFMGKSSKKVGVSIAMFFDWLVIYFQWDDSPQLLADFEHVFFEKNPMGDDDSLFLTKPLRFQY